MRAVLRPLWLSALLLLSLAPTCWPGDPKKAGDEPYPHLVMGNPSKAVENEKKKNNFLMKKPFFALAYNNANGTPRWVSWRLTKEDLGTAKRVPFYPDKLPEGFTQVVPKDYTGSGFDRGHMCPHSDRSSTPDASRATFVMTNMIPQSPEVNQHAWNALESYCRYLVQKKNKTLYIICGPAGKGGTARNGFKVRLKGKVTVPAACWKVIVVLDNAKKNGKDDAARVTASTRVISVIMPNDRSVGDDWTPYRRTLRQVEELTGLRLLDRVPDEVVDELRDERDQVRVPRGLVEREED
jgi:endonuclease G, mitochondrial